MKNNYINNSLINNKYNFNTKDKKKVLNIN